MLVTVELNIKDNYFLRLFDGKFLSHLHNYTKPNKKEPKQKESIYLNNLENTKDVFDDERLVFDDVEVLWWIVGYFSRSE